MTRAELPAAEKVARAWLIPGHRPDVHRQAKAKLWREWPALAEAVAQLAEQVTEEKRRAHRGDAE